MKPVVYTWLRPGIVNCSRLNNQGSAAFSETGGSTLVVVCNYIQGTHLGAPTALYGRQSVFLGRSETFGYGSREWNDAIR